MDRLEPNKGKQTKLLTELLTGQRTLPTTEEELQREENNKGIGRATESQRESNISHEAAMAVHIAQQTIALALAARATSEEARTAGNAATGTILGEGGTTLVLEQ